MLLVPAAQIPFEFARPLVPSGSRAAAGAVCPLPVAAITVSPEIEILNDRKGQIVTQTMPNCSTK